MTTRYQPNERLVHLGHSITNDLAVLVTEALDHIGSELRALDGYPTKTPGASPPTATGQHCKGCHGEGCERCQHVDMTLPERQANARYRLTSRREQLRDDLQMLEDLYLNMSRVCKGTIGIRIPLEKATCYADPGLAGYLVPLSEGGWFDASCTALSRTSKPGLCDKHRKALDRYRERTGQKPLADDRDIEHDSEIHTVNGVAIIRPVRGAA